MIKKNKYYNNNKKYGYNNKYKNNDYNKNKVPYNTREFNDGSNKNIKYRKFDEGEELPEKEEEDIKKPLFYNSKIQDSQNMFQNQIQYIKIEDFIQVDNLKEEINNIVKETYLNLKSKIKKSLEEQYGSLNINAKTYVPKRKILKDNNFGGNNNINNYGQNYVNNNIFQQNYMAPY